MRKLSENDCNESTTRPRTDLLIFLIVAPFLPAAAIGWIIGSIAGKIARRFDHPDYVGETDG